MLLNFFVSFALYSLDFLRRPFKRFHFSTPIICSVFAVVVEYWHHAKARIEGANAVRLRSCAAVAGVDTRGQNFSSQWAGRLLGEFEHLGIVPLKLLARLARRLLFGCRSLARAIPHHRVVDQRLKTHADQFAP